MRALQHGSHGPPDEALELVEVDAPTPGKADVLVRVQASPINPADLLTLRGLYPIKSELPRIAGIEGIGIIEQVGSAITSLKRGQLVCLPVRAAPWADLALARGPECLPLPPDVDPVQVCMIQINALTAKVLLTEFRMLNRGDWIIQSPGSSSVGQYVIQMAEMIGVKTINVIRRPERAEHLEALGANVVLLDGDDLPARVREATGGAEVGLAFDAMGGQTTDRLAACMSRNGLVICYGAVSRKPAQLSVMQSVFRGIRLRGFWLYPWKRKDMERTRRILSELADDFEASRLITEIAGEFSLDNWQEAFALAASPERNGRVVFRPDL